MSKLMRMLVFQLVAAVALYAFTTQIALSQTEEEAKEIMVNALTLFKAQRYSESIPYFEKLVKIVPDVPEINFAYGFALLAKSKQDATPEEAKILAEKALEQFKAAKENGLNDPSNDALIKLLSGEISEGEGESFSSNPEANKLVNQGEVYFAQGKYDESIAAFQKALEIDPNIYQAAISLGDCYVAKKDWTNAENYYQKAIEIDPTRETAYRYSATPLMRQEKYEEARDRYIEAFITEPYSGMSQRGITQWAEVTGAKLGHPAVDIPEFSHDSAGKPVTKMNENSLTEGSKAWVAYSVTRENWYKEKFVKTFPGEKEYRHTLQEEIEAIRSTLKSAKNQNLSHPHFAVLQKLDDEGLLESFILMSQADEGIAADYAEYITNNRDKLRKYVLHYVIKN